MTTKKKAKRKPSANGTNRIKDAVPAEGPIVIAAPRFHTIGVRIVGDAPYCQNKFSARSFEGIMEAQKQGNSAKNKKGNSAKDFEAEFEGATYRMEDGSFGIPCSAIRNGCISACRVAGFVMTKAKLSIFCESDGIDVDDATPLVRLHGDREMSVMKVRLPNGSLDLRPRPIWKQWFADLRLRFDLDQFREVDVLNLLMRVGMQVGVGEGRHDSKNSTGIGFGSFKIEEVG